VCFFAHTDAELRAAPAPLMVLNGSGGMVAAGAPAGLQAWAAPEGLPQGQGALGGFPPGLRQQEPLQQQQLLFQQFSQLGMAPQQQQPAAMNGNNMVVLSPSTGLQMVQGGQGLLLPSMPLAAAGPAHQFAGLPADAAAAAAGMGGGAYMPGMAAAPPTAFGPAATGSGQMLVVMGSQVGAPRRTKQMSPGAASCCCGRTLHLAGYTSRLCVEGSGCCSRSLWHAVCPVCGWYVGLPKQSADMH
jgi:hypothetical protein